MSRRNWLFLAMALTAGGVGAAPVSVEVQNHSFESPTVPTGLPVSLTTDAWTLNGAGTLVPVPGVGNVPGGAGVFPNPDSSSAGHLNNADGGNATTPAQVAYMFSNVGNSITQALAASVGGQPLTFGAGLRYTLTASVAYAQSAPPATDRLAFELYYTDNAGTHVVLQAPLSNVNASPAINQQTLQDYSFTSPLLSVGNAAIGQQINVGFFALDNGGGEFDIDNVRLVSNTPEPASLAGMATIALIARRRRRG